MFHVMFSSYAYYYVINKTDNEPSVRTIRLSKLIIQPTGQIIGSIRDDIISICK